MVSEQNLLGLRTVFTQTTSKQWFTSRAEIARFSIKITSLARLWSKWNNATIIHSIYHFNGFRGISKFSFLVSRVSRALDKRNLLTVIMPNTLPFVALWVKLWINIGLHVFALFESVTLCSRSWCPLECRYLYQLHSSEANHTTRLASMTRLSANIHKLRHLLSIYIVFCRWDNHRLN